MAAPKSGEIYTTLINSQLFSGLSESELADFSKIVKVRAYKKSDVIFSEGDHAEGFFIVKTGQVKIYRISSAGKTHVVHIFGPGNPFGEAAIFMENSFPAYAEAVTDCELIFINFESFMAYLKKEPRFALNIIATLCIRLKSFLKTIEELSLDEVSTRLVKYLINRAVEIHKHPRDGCVITLDIKKSVLANQIGTIPETLSRTLSKLKKSGAISADGNRITIVKFHRLQEGLGEN